MSLTKEMILGRKRTPPRPVYVPDWDLTVFVRMIDGRQRERYEKIHQGDRPEIRATMLAFSLSDESGKPLFTEAEIPAINELDAKSLMMLYDVALEVNKVTREEIEDLAGN